MPKRTDIKSILIIGAGPIVIGQACEFDYSGAQACKALREEGYRIILVNSNPATIMTDPDMADVTYIEPINWQTVEKIISRERPDVQEQIDLGGRQPGGLTHVIQDWPADTGGAVVRPLASFCSTPARRSASGSSVSTRFHCHSASRRRPSSAP